MDAYGPAKRLLFAWPGLKAAVINVDDAQAPRWPRWPDGSGLDLWTCRRRTGAAARGELGYIDGGLAFELHEGGRRRRCAAR